MGFVLLCVFVCVVLRVLFWARGPVCLQVSCVRACVLRFIPCTPCFLLCMCARCACVCDYGCGGVDARPPRLAEAAKVAKDSTAVGSKERAEAVITLETYKSLGQALNITV